MHHNWIYYDSENYSHPILKYVFFSFFWPFFWGGWGAWKLFVLVNITKTNKSATAYLSANEMTSYIHLRRIILVSNHFPPFNFRLILQKMNHKPTGELKIGKINWTLFTIQWNLVLRPWTKILFCFRKKRNVLWFHVRLYYQWSI